MSAPRGQVFRYRDYAVDAGRGVLSLRYELDGREFMGLNGGPLFNFDEAISLVVHCDDQAEIDSYWEKLTADGGQESQCGWLKDKYGLSWQIVPSIIGQLLTGDQEKTDRVMKAVMTMKKLDLQKMKDAADGSPNFGTATDWRRIGTIHHITCAVQLIRDLPWP